MEIRVHHFLDQLPGGFQMSVELKGQERTEKLKEHSVERYIRYQNISTILPFMATGGRNP